MKTVNPDPVHEYLGVWWFFDETWAERIGSFVSREAAQEGFELYAKHLNKEKEEK